MRNPIFREQVNSLFEKQALFQDPHEVLRKMPVKDSGDLRRGLTLIENAKDLGYGLVDIGKAGYHGLSKILSPPELGESNTVVKGLRGVGNYFSKHPKAVRGALGGVLMLPILSKAFYASQKKDEDELMRGYLNPTQKYAMSPEEARKKLLSEIEEAAKRGASKKESPKFWPSLGMGVVKGLGESAGGTLVGLAAHGIGKGFTALRDHFLSDPQRKALVETLLRTDPVLSDAVERNPDMINVVKEAYGTMQRFAPTLSLDVNAVRSFLREAILGGAGVNYATIKNLVDTERSVADAKPSYSFGKG